MLSLPQGRDLEQLLGAPGSLMKLPPGFTSRVDLSGHKLRIRCASLALHECVCVCVFI